MSVYRVGSNKSSVNNFPTVRPTLDLDFANSKTLDPRITFTRASGGSYVGADGLIKYAGVNEARFDHDPVTGESLGLLIEESRNNFCRYGSEIHRFTSRTGGIKIENAAIAPDGTLTATRLIGNGIVSPYYDNNQAITYTAGKTYTFSVFAKANTTGRFAILLYDNVSALWNGNISTANVVGNFDVANGVLLPANRSATGGTRIEKYPNGWYRCSITETCAISHALVHQLIRSDATSDLFFWGYQVEEGAFPTSYIPTQASTRTRAADNPSITGSNFSSWYRQDEGTIFAKWSYPHTPSGFTRVWDFTNNINLFNNGFTISTNFFSDNRFGLFINSVAIFEQQYGPSASPNKLMRSAITLKSGSHAFTGNEVRPQINNNKNMPVGIDRCFIGNLNGGSQLNGHIRSLKYYPKRLSNEQLQVLTR